LSSNIYNEAEPLNPKLFNGLQAQAQREAQPHRKRRRNSWFIVANEKAKEVHLEGWEQLFDVVLNELVGFAKNYKVEVKDKKIVLVHEGYDKVLILDYTTRFSPEYIRKVRAKLNKIIEIYNLLESYDMKFKVTHIVLTVRVRDYYSLYDLFQNLKRGFHKFITHLRYYVDVDGYVRFIEIGKVHNVVHVHVAVINKVGVINRDIVQRCWGWKDYTLGNINLSYFDNIGRGIKYISKYISKSLNDVDNEDSLSFRLLALLWSLNARVYSTSAKILSQVDFSLDSIRLSAKIRWWGFVVQDPGLQWFYGRFSDLSPPVEYIGEWFYVGSFSPDLVPLPSGIYHYEHVRVYLESLM
jgi:predicted DNA-binding transcriptional regulator